MVDIDTHRIIDILPSREIEDVTEWLSSFPNLEIVSRDGSVSYNNAIKQANEAIVQISDRFHLLKGLTDAARKYITSIVAANIGILVPESHYENIGATDYWDKDQGDDFPTREHNANYEKKKKLVNQVKALTKAGKKRSEIAEETGVSYNTVKRYQSPDFNITNGLYNTTRGSKIKPFVETIKQMIENGDTFKKIEEVIKKDGYTGASSTIRMYATRERKLIKEAKKNCQGKSEKIERKWLISLLYKPIDKIKKLSQGQVDRVIERYPEIGEIYDIVGAFKNTLFSKESDEIEKWMSDAETLDVETINSFVNGIRRDLSAVKKAIELDYNNGLAEGSVNKLKVIKQIMYGRSSFELLKAKLLRLELKRKIN